MELRDTVEDMLSADYGDRMRAEYWQLAVRLLDLAAYLDNWDENQEHTCPKEMLERQLSAMLVYQGLLFDRAELEGITL